MLLRRTVLVLGGSVMLGCATTEHPPEYYKPPPPVALQDPPPGMAVVYLIRTPHDSQTVVVHVAGMAPFSLPPETHTVLLLKPGTYALQGTRSGLFSGGQPSFAPRAVADAGRSAAVPVPVWQHRARCSAGGVHPGRGWWCGAFGDPWHGHRCQHAVVEELLRAGRAGFSVHRTLRQAGLSVQSLFSMRCTSGCCTLRAVPMAKKCSSTPSQGANHCRP